MPKLSARLALAACSVLALGLTPFAAQAKPAKAETSQQASDIPAKWEAPAPATITTSAR
jgi:hypothetical protein